MYDVESHRVKKKREFFEEYNMWFIFFGHFDCEIHFHLDWLLDFDCTSKRVKEKERKEEKEK